MHLTKKDNLIGSFMLVIASLIWGFAFAFQVEASGYVSPFGINGVRMMLGAITLLPFIIITKNLCINKNAIIGGSICGAVLFASATMQQLGISLYSESEAAAGKSGFITTLYIIIVPLFSFLFFKIKISKSILISVILAIIGMFLLCIKDSFTLSIADSFLLISAFCYAGHILVVDYFVKKANPLTLSCLQLFVTSILSLIIMFFTEKNTLSGFYSAAFPIIFLGVFSAGIAYTLQVTGQKRITITATASLLMSLESVFAAISGFLLLGERLTFKEVCGCILVFIAVILAQIDIKSLFLKKSRLIK